MKITTPYSRELNVDLQFDRAGVQLDVVNTGNDRTMYTFLPLKEARQLRDFLNSLNLGEEPKPQQVSLFFFLGAEAERVAA